MIFKGLFRKGSYVSFSQRLFSEIKKFFRIEDFRELPVCRWRLSFRSFLVVTICPILARQYLQKQPPKKIRLFWAAFLILNWNSILFSGKSFDWPSARVPSLNSRKYCSHFRLTPDQTEIDTIVNFSLNSHASGWSLWRPKAVKSILWETVSLIRLHFFRY